VNDVSGIPSIDVDANGTVSMVSYGGSVGIGTTLASQKLHVQGNVRITGGLYDSNDNVGTAGSVLSSTGSGLSWIAAGGGVPAYATSAGIATYATNAGIATSVIGGIASVTQLSVSGVSTLGITSATNLTAQQLNVSGLSTFAGITTYTASLFGTTASFSGIVTASSFRGDGSQLTGISASGGISISTNTTNQSQYLTYTIGTGSTTGLGVTTTGLVFNPSTNNLGIGTASPAFKVDIAGDARVTSTNKMRFGGTAGTTNFYIQYNSTTNSLDFVAG
jgi:hypothetical protein